MKIEQHPWKWDWKERNKKSWDEIWRSEDREGERNESPDGAGRERNRDGVSKRRAASERDIHPQGPMQPLFFKGNPAHAHRDGTDILFTVVHLPPGLKWSHNHITHSQRPPILQVQSHTHTFILLFFSASFIRIAMPVHSEHAHK